MIRFFLILILGFLCSSEYQIKAAFQNKSKISYLGSHPAHDWIGVSQKFKGGVVCDDSLECLIKIQIPVESFDSANSNRDSNMLYYVESNKYKYVTFYSDSFKFDSDLLLSGKSINLNGELDFHGIRKDISFDVLITSDSQFLRGQTQFDIRLSDYNVERPSLLFVPISNQVTIKCDLYCLIKEFKVGLEE
tara:strand:+ start:2143 stop:2715 length:573 start_codon:yes stop_codon:yes gene_type:complete